MIEKLYFDNDLRKKIVNAGQKRLSELYSQERKKKSMNQIFNYLFK